MSRGIVVWLVVLAVAAALWLASANRRDHKQLLLGLGILTLVATAIGGGYAYLAWRDGLLDVSVFDWLFGPR